ncbi:autophagy-related protein 22 [Aspergillus udagawae]|uniref:Autophagy-related protein n=1 Tax=Aspergillus udagawae TaxID=91492 RepID=A0ABQ1BEL1_9EURO|nr:autophagy-related protein 22 [Aspergillus udagawae]GFF61788.1 autophagy-related protein 22 [Aspergillus udagawae]GFG00044.1 autophagy-related protein 22 [Aspergillus udagawae]GFG20757.1 autophagy-related protein 22 [Aspergillus udagawae]
MHTGPSIEEDIPRDDGDTDKHGLRPTVQHDVDDLEGARSKAVFNSKRALWAFLFLCYSTGPASSMASTYVSAAILSAANLLGHQAGSNKRCSHRGTNISCLVKFGAGEIDYNSYTLYLRAISRAAEGIVSIITAGLADYLYYRKTMMMTSIFLFGALALPFAGLTGRTYSHLTALSVLYCLLTTVGGIYTVIEGSYIPIFMRSTGCFRDSKIAGFQGERTVWYKGVSVSVLALVSSNVGGLTALIIGVILVYGRGSYVKVGYFNYLLAITIAGCITILFAILGQCLLPSVRGKEFDRTKDKRPMLVPAKNWFRLLRNAPRYSEAFKLCIGWVLWNTGYSNHLQLIGALFLQVTGFSTSSGVYSVWSFTSVAFACMGSLGFMYLYPQLRLSVKSWAYALLLVNIVCVLWGCMGISNNIAIGYKHQAEFWVEQVLFMSTSSALRAYNRAIYSSLIPENSEAQFFGLEITLDLATGWINPLVMGVIQDRTHNLRFPMIPNLLLMVVGFVFYWLVDVPKGIEQAKVPLEQ